MVCSSFRYRTGALHHALASTNFPSFQFLFPPPKLFLNGDDGAGPLVLEVKHHVWGFGKSVRAADPPWPDSFRRSRINRLWYRSARPTSRAEASPIRMDRFRSCRHARECSRRKILGASYCKSPRSPQSASRESADYFSRVTSIPVISLRRTDPVLQRREATITTSRRSKRERVALMRSLSIRR